MASLNVLTFDAEGRAVDFEVWLDDLQLLLQCDSKDGLSLFDLTSGASTAPTADADNTVRSQWLTRDAAARLAVRNHLPSTERAHFSQYKSAKGLYDAVVACYSSPTTAALSRLMLPYLFPDLAAFATLADLVAHLRTSDARYRAALPTEFLPTNSPPMYITLYYLVTRLPDSLSSVRDHFLSLCPTALTVDLLEERLAAAEKSILAVGASRGDCRTPFFEGCSPVPLLPSVASAAAVDLVGTEQVGTVSTPSGRHRTGKGKGSKGGGGGGGRIGGGGGGGGGGGPAGGGVAGGSGGRGGGGRGGGGGGSGGGGSGRGGTGRGAATQRGGLGGGQRQQQLRTRETPSVQQLHEWYARRGRSGGAGPCTYVLRTGTRSGEVCGLPHATQRCFGLLTNAWRTQFPDAVELPRWHDLLLQNVPIFDLDFDAILAAMYALADITEGDCYLRVPPDPGTMAAALGASAAAALGASASAAPGAGTSPLSGIAPTESFHTFTLDSGASRSFFRDSTTLTPLSRPVAVYVADPSGGPVLAHSSTVLPCPAAPSGLLSGLHLPSFSTNLVSGADLQDAWVDKFTPGGHRVTHCTCSRTGHHLATFTRQPGSSQYTLSTAPPPVSVSGQVVASSQVFAAASRTSPASAPCSCRPLAHETLLGTTALVTPPCLVFKVWRPVPLSRVYPGPSLPFLRGLAPPVFLVLRAGNAPPLTPPRFLRLRPLSRLFTWTCGAQPTSVDRVTSATSSWSLTTTRVTPQSSPCDLRSLRGGEFSSDLLRAFCRLEGIRETFTLPASPQQNGIAERRIGLVMDIARTSMIHAAAPHFLWPFAVQYAVHQINLQPCVSLPETTHTPSAGSRFPPSPGPPPPFLSPPPVQSQSQLQPAPPLPGPSPYSGPTRGLTERYEPESRPVSPASRSASPRLPLPSPPASSLPDGPDPESDSLRAASPSVTRFLATAVTDPLFESSAASALVAELVDFAAACRLDYATSLVAVSASVCPLSVGGECALGTDVLEDRQEDLECFAVASPHLVSMLLAPEGDPDALDILTPRSYAEVIEGPYTSQWQAAMDAEMASSKSTSTYVDEVPPPGVNIVSGMWIFRVKRPPGSPPAFKRDYELHSLDFCTAFLQGSLHEEIWLRCPPSFTGSFPAGTQWSLRRPVYGLRQAPRKWHDTLRTTLAALGFAPSTADPCLFLRTDATLPPFYVLVYVDYLVFATADTEALAHVKSELQKRHTCTYLGPSALRLHVLLATVHSSAYRSLALSSTFGRVRRAEWPNPELVGYLMYLMTCTRPDLAYPLSLLAHYVARGRHQKVHWDVAKRVLQYLWSTSSMGLVLEGRARVVLTGHAEASWVDDLATQRSSQGYTFSLGSGSVSWRSTRSSSVLSSSCEAEIYAGAMAAQELRWLTYLLTDLGEAPRSPPVLYVDNKAMLALCQEHRLEHRTKHIALRYFLARELQQRGQLRLAYVAAQANTADVFTKALQPCDHQRFCTMLGLVPTVPHLLTS
ncbi:unnamed protein product [Closterium sp. NIES-54]